MPVSKRSRPESDEIWRRHASEIQKLYRNNTVENVKRFMEETRGFPEMAVPTWNEKLGELGMRKNVTQNEWRKIYRHCRPRLEDSTRQRGDLKLKRTRKKTEVVVRNRPYTWDKAWKNMKNAGAIAQLLSPEGPLSPLPPDIVIRTPIATPSLSPSLPPIVPPSLEDIWGRSTGSTNTRETGSMLHGCEPINKESNDCLSSDMEALFPLDHLETRTVVSTAEHAQLVCKLCVTGLPIEQIVAYAVGIEKGTSSSETIIQDILLHLIPNFVFISLPFEYHARQSFTPQFLSAVFTRALNDPAAITSQKNYVLMFLLVYAISNKIRLFSEHYKIFENLDALLEAVPGKYLDALLIKPLASVRAAFETSLDLAGEYKQPDAFRFLVKVGATHRWLAISAKGHMFLFYAASMNLVSTLQMLLNLGCRPDSSITYCHLNSIHQTAIVKALSCGNSRCAQLLLQSCDVNKQIQFAYPKTNFEHFLRDLGDIGELSGSGLKLFVQAGADLDQPICGHMIRISPHWPWSLSVADYLFYFHRSLLDILSPGSYQVRHGHLSRAGILLSLEAGTQTLEAYFGSLLPQSSQWSLAEFFQGLITEQFLIYDLHHRKRDTDLGIVRVLVSFGARFNAGISEVIRRAPEILHSFVKLVGDGCNRSQIEAALYLAENGAAVTGRVLSWMARLPDINHFALTLRSINGQGGLEVAVIDSAARNNFKAVERLIQAGAKLGTDCRRSGSDRRVSITASVLSSYEQESPTQMLDFLVKKGAPLRLSKRKPHLHHLLQFTLRFYGNARDAAYMERVRYIVGAGYDLQNAPFPTEQLLESCCNMQVFEYLYKNGAQLRPGSPLAVWINLGGGIGLCREMLSAGANPSSYARYNSPWMLRTPLQVAARNCRMDVVDLLLETGSDVNAPAKGSSGFTALQASCRFRIETLEDQQRKLRIICTLLSHGADVNAAPARVGGRTALQEAAVSGDLTVAKLLLFNNPMADVNAPPCESWVSDTEDQDSGYEEPNLGTALDLAAGRGRLDMVKLLLNCNGLSHHWGKTGYDGAIQVARNAGYLAVADLIRQHSEDTKQSGTGPDLSQPPRFWYEYDYESGPAEASDNSEDETSTILSDDDELSEDKWENNAIGFASSGTHPSDLISTAHDLDTRNSAILPGRDASPSPRATANDNRTWNNQKDSILAQDEELMGICHFVPGNPEIVINNSMNFRMLRRWN